MEQARYDVVTRALTHFPSRRDVLRGIANAGLGLGALKMPDIVEARKTKRKRKKKNKPLVFNQHGCVDTGQPCWGDSKNCCSGICEGAAPRKGKRDQSRCVPHNAGICTLDTNTCEVGVEVPCGPSNLRGACTLTTGNAAFCADVSAGTSAHCRVCSKDADCQGEFGAGAACVLLGGLCTPLCVDTGRTACFPPAA